MSAQLPLRWVKPLEPWALSLFFGALRTNVFANEASKCAYIEVSFELKRKPYKYFMNFYPLYEVLNNYFLIKRCNHERLKKHFARS